MPSWWNRVDGTFVRASQWVLTFRVEDWWKTQLRGDALIAEAVEDWDTVRIQNGVLVALRWKSGSTVDQRTAVVRALHERMPALEAMMAMLATVGET